MTRAICIASGTSLTKEDVEFCRGKGKIYAVKEVYHYAPWADVLYAADGDWWDRLKGVPDFKGERWTVSDEAAKRWRLNYIKYRVDLPWSKDPAILATGGNSGFQAANLAMLQGATEVILLGYDMGYSGSRKHFWTGLESVPTREIRPSDYNGWLKRWNFALPHIPYPIINCSRSSYLNYFPKKTLEEALS
jgi:hypothetical protein